MLLTKGMKAALLVVQPTCWLLSKWSISVRCVIVQPHLSMTTRFQPRVLCETDSSVLFTLM